MSIQLSPDQDKALNQILDWYLGETHYQAPGLQKLGKQTLTMGGYAGTGKTTILNEFRKRFHGTIAFLSLTGKAVMTMQSKIDAPGDYIQTIHSFMYFPVVDEETKKIIDWDRREMQNPAMPHDPRCCPHVDLIINDEAGMTDESLHAGLLSYKVPVLFVGDHGQLPPIKGSLNLMENPEIRLEKIHRQSEGNPILKLADQARNFGSLKLGKYSDKVQVLRTADMGTGTLFSFLTELMFTPSPDTLMITAKNIDRIKLNRTVLKINDLPSTPFEGARLICLRNNRKIGLFNGMFVTVLANMGEGKERNTWLLKLLPDGTDYPLITEVSKDVFFCEKPANLDWRTTRGNWFDFGYAITCHKAQGSEAKRVFVIGSGFGSAENKRRWLYTAVTRAQEELYVLS